MKSFAQRGQFSPALLEERRLAYKAMKEKRDANREHAHYEGKHETPNGLCKLCGRHA